MEGRWVADAHEHCLAKGSWDQWFGTAATVIPDSFEDYARIFHGGSWARGSWPRSQRCSARTPPGGQGIFQAVWVGWGGFDPGTGGIPTGTGGPLSAARGFREYWVFRGTIAEPARPPWFRDGSDGDGLDVNTQTPNLARPADRSWCLATGVDFDSTLVGGTAELVAAAGGCRSRRANGVHCLPAQLGMNFFGFRLGCSDFISARTPATCGDAMEVPPSSPYLLLDGCVMQNTSTLSLRDGLVQGRGRESCHCAPHPGRPCRRIDRCPCT